MLAFKTDQKFENKTKYKVCIFLISIHLLPCAVFFLAATEWKRPAAGLQPRLPQDLLPRQLVLRGYQFLLVFLRSFGGPLQDLGVPRLSVGAQRAGL